MRADFLSSFHRSFTEAAANLALRKDNDTIQKQQKQKKNNLTPTPPLRTLLVTPRNGTNFCLRKLAALCEKTSTTGTSAWISIHTETVLALRVSGWTMLIW